MSAGSRTSRELQAGSMARFAVVSAIGATICVISELIGTITVQLGVVALALFPMVWGIAIGGAISFQKLRPMGLPLQSIADSFVAVGVNMLVARVTFTIGPNIDVLAGAGPVILVQEAGHMIGTVLLALPLAVLLGMGRATIGATFSLDREASFAIVGERFGHGSDEYRGVLAMYVFGTLFGAAYISLLASVLANASWFNPLALAMGAGVGSGSMMVAAVAAIAAVHPEQAGMITAVSAVSNLVTSVLGVYVGIYVALPLATRFYHVLSRRQRSTSTVVGRPAENVLARQVNDSGAVVQVRTWLVTVILSVTGMLGAMVSLQRFDWQIVLGYATMTAVFSVGSLLAAATRRKVSSTLFIAIIATLVSLPWSPVAWLAQSVAAVPLPTIATLVLIFTGLSLGKNARVLARIGWRIIPVGLVAISASFILSTVIAELALRLGE